MRNLIMRCVPLLLWCGALVGCAPEGDTSPAAAVSVRDSAGIEIVEVRNPFWGPGDGWTLGRDPILEIGRVDGAEPYQLFRVAGAFRLGNGSILIVNRGTQELRWFDPRGQHVRSVGGPGGGPGEFDSLFGAGALGDTVHAHDFRTARITVFDSAGAVVRTVQLEEVPPLPIEVWPSAEGYIAWIIDAPESLNPELTYHRRLARYVAYDRDGAVRRSITEMPGTEFIMSGGPSGNQFVAVSRAPLIGHGTQQTVVGGRLVAGTTDRFELRVFDAAGRLERLIRDASRTVPVSNAEWQAVQDEALAEAETPEQRRVVHDLTELRPKPETRPAFGRFVADRAGYVWVAPWRPVEGPTVPWLIADPAGPILGTVALPAGFRPTDIGADYVLGVTRDALDVERVRMYELTRQ
jgi:hypothetical protein